MAKKRLDVLIVEKGLAESRTKAQARILAGEVVVDDHRVDKPGQMVKETVAIRFKGNAIPYVSRGGLKLEDAIKRWPGSIKDAVCLDVGSSTGGFTDVLLQAGAKQVFAVDVGTNQLAYALRQDPRVVVFEKTHIVHAPVGKFEPKPTIVVVDVSFISLERVLPAILQHLGATAQLYLLIKPQFEVGAANIAKGGIVKDVAIREQARDRILNKAQELGLKLLGCHESPITGTEGNVEYIASFELIKTP